VDLGGRLALRARSAGSGTGVRVALGASTVDQAPPASGLAASGHAQVLDALGWAMLAGGAGGGDGGMPLRGIDVTAARLQLLGAGFENVRLRAGEAGGATEVHFEGDALSGTLAIPRDRAATVDGRFARLHWPAPPPRPEAQAAVPPPV